MQSNTNKKTKVILQSNTMENIKCIRLTDEQYKNWDKKIHPKLFRFILEEKIAVDGIILVDIKELLGYESVDCKEKDITGSF